MFSLKYQQMRLLSKVQKMNCDIFTFVVHVYFTSAIFRYIVPHVDHFLFRLAQSCTSNCHSAISSKSPIFFSSSISKCHLHDMTMKYYKLYIIKLFGEVQYSIDILYIYLIYITNTFIKFYFEVQNNFCYPIFTNFKHLQICI